MSGVILNDVKVMPSVRLALSAVSNIRSAVCIRSGKEGNGDEKRGGQTVTPQLITKAGPRLGCNSDVGN